MGKHAHMLRDAAARFGCDTLQRTLGVSPDAFNSWLTGLEEPPAETRLDLADLLASMHARQNIPPQTSARLSRPRRVLVLDPYADSAEAIALALELLGYESRAITDPSEAEGTASSFRPDFAIFETRMPNIDGLALASRFRSHADLCRIRLIALSASTDVAHRRAIAAAGFEAHVPKPADAYFIDALLTVLTAA